MVLIQQLTNQQNMLGAIWSRPSAASHREQRYSKRTEKGFLVHGEQNLDQARAGLAQHLEASVKPKEEKEWKPSKWNPVKPYYKKAAKWLGTTLDEVLADDDDIDLEHLSRGHLSL